MELTTPIGTAVYPHLSSPDFKFNKHGDFTCKVRFDGETFKPLKAQLDKAFDLALSEARAKKPGATEGACGYKQESDGSYVVNTKMQAHVEPRQGEAWDQRPALFGPNGNEFTGGRIGGGSQVQLNFEIVNYSAAFGAGISLRLIGAMIHKLVLAKDPNDARTYGFDVNPDCGETFEGGDMPPEDADFANPEDCEPVGDFGAGDDKTEVPF